MTNDNETHDDGNDAGFPENLDEAKGRAKQAVGDLTGDDDLKHEGEADEVAGGIKGKIDEVADRIKDAVDDLRERFTD